MSVSLKTRGLVFATFFGSCLIIGLLVAALTTEYWIESNAKHHDVEEGQGKIKFGLFSGSKNLNKKFGWRYNTTDGIRCVFIFDGLLKLMKFVFACFLVHSLIQDDVIQYTWWLLTALGVGLGLLSSFIGGKL